MKFAWMITKSTKNIGDEFQCLAARQFIDNKEINFEIDREYMSEYDGDDVKMIMNGWYMHEPKNWPPSKSITPLMISMHFSNHIQKNGIRPIDFILNENGIEYLRNNSPIGCRDLYMHKLLTKKKVPNYFSGCMTLTLPKKNLSKKDYICLVDMDDDIYNYLKNNTNKKIIRIEHEKKWPSNYDDRVEEAKKLLVLYEEASCVITNRLHAALPNLALETPVLLIRNKFGDERFTGLKELVNYCTKDELLSGKYPFDINNPMKNPQEYLVLRNNNIKISKAFIDDSYIDLKKIHEENMNAINSAIKRNIEFRKNNKLTSYRYMEFLYLIRHNFRNIVKK